MKFIPLFIILPLLCAFILTLFGKRNPRISALFSTATTLLLAILSVFTIIKVNSNALPLIYEIGGWGPTVG
ncbi:MAG: hypothetical protein PHP17_08070, partial [Candidatus Omnitrophica bacterium]|nr:hypothetical protein [Candidatus Omnitrophota bacterium]